MKKRLLLLSLVTGVILQSSAQEFIPGQAYFGTNDYIEYIAGNLPIVLSAPHGGNWQPAEIPDRNCSGCSYVNDAYTQELGREILNALHELTGCYPHLVINRLHRRKLDANRDLPEAANGNPLAAQAWTDFHAFIDTARSQLLNTWGKGFYLDLHGHGHSIQRIELGYLLYDDELQLSDSVLNLANYIDYSSIRSLALSNVSNFTHAELLRGPHSLGTYLADLAYPSVPSEDDPFPGNNDPYFSGGYNTARHSSYQGGTIDGVQMECNQSIRFDETVRKAFAQHFADAILDFLQKHYFPNLPAAFCTTTLATENVRPAVKIYPNPVCQMLFTQQGALVTRVKIYNSLGQLMVEENNSDRADLSALPDGAYYAIFILENEAVQIKKVVKTCR